MLEGEVYAQSFPVPWLHGSLNGEYVFSTRKFVGVSQHVQTNPDIDPKISFSLLKFHICWIESKYTRDPVNIMNNK